MRRSLILNVALLGIGLTSLAWGYQYFDREDLSAELAENVGKQVKVVDEIISIYPDGQTLDGYFKFDTVHFRCLIADDNADAIQYVKDTGTMEKKGSRRVKRLVAIEGTVERRDVYGEVKGGDAGVVSEQILLIVDGAKKPRARFYKDLD